MINHDQQLQKLIEAIKKNRDFINKKSSDEAAEPKDDPLIPKKLDENSKTDDEFI